MSSARSFALGAVLLFVICSLSKGSGENDMELTSLFAETDLNSMQEKMGEAQRAFLQLFEKANGSNGCWCSKLSCQCCQRINLPRYRICTTASVTVTLVSRWNVRVVFVVSGRTIYNGVIGGQRPRKLNLRVPFLRRCASVVLQLYGTRVCRRTITGCARITLRMGHCVIGTFNLGCYRMTCVDSMMPNETPLELTAASDEGPVEFDELPYNEDDEDVVSMDGMEEPWNADNIRM